MISISKQFGELASAGCSVVGVVGAGGIGREYLEVALRYEKNRRALDEIAIRVSRCNALLLIARLRRIGARVFPRPLTALKQLGEPWFSSGNAITIFGGLRPGLTSDSTAALIAKKLRAPLLIVSTAGGVREEDLGETKPKRPRLLPEVDKAYLRELSTRLSSSSESAPHVFDLQTCKILLKETSRRRPALGPVLVTGYENIRDCAVAAADEIKMRRGQRGDEKPLLKYTRVLL